MEDQFLRTRLLLGSEAVEKLQKARVAVFGIGGVGGYVVEALARTGVGILDLIDNDVVSVTNINRQIIAAWSSLGKPKVEVMRERIKDINPGAEIRVHQCFYLPETAGGFDFTDYDYVVDAVDTVTAKISIIMEAKKAGTPVISSMGAGNKIEPSMFEVADIYKTTMCPLAKVMRRELKKRGVGDLKVVYSKEPPKTPLEKERINLEAEMAEDECSRKVTPGSLAFVPSVAGLIIAGEVVKDLIR